LIKAVTRRGKVWRSEAGLGRALHGRHGRAWMGVDGPRHGRHGVARHDKAGKGRARQAINNAARLGPL